MKFSTATLTLLSLTSSSLAYDTANDVTNAFNSAKDVASITSKVGTDAAYTEYTSGAGNFDSTIQNLAQGAEGPFLAGFTALFGESHLDTFTSNGLQCNGSFAGQSQDICDMMAKKMLLCTTLGYSWTQGYKAIAAAESGDGAEAVRLWDEFYAYWWGDNGSSSAAEVQSKRDLDFGTSFKDDAMNAMMAGQTSAQATPPDVTGMSTAMTNFNKAIVSTFAQATLKYAFRAEVAEANTDTEDIQWAEGYAYFACAAGIMDSDLADFVNEKLDPRRMETVPDGLFCEIDSKMQNTTDIGAGTTYASLKRFKDTPAQFCEEGFVSGSTSVHSLALRALGLASVVTGAVMLLG